MAGGKWEWKMEVGLSEWVACKNATKECYDEHSTHFVISFRPLHLMDS